VTNSLLSAEALDPVALIALGNSCLETANTVMLRMEH
jgi:hypothetical protein